MLKNWLIIGLVLIITYVGLQALVTRYVPGASMQPTFSATGEERFLAKPQEATIHFTVNSKGKDSSAAINANKRITDTITNALKATGINSNDITIDGLQVYLPYDNNEQEAVTNVTVKTQKVDQVNDYVSAGFSAGATTMTGVDYKPAEGNSEEASARTKAYEKAQQKAEQLAKMAGKRLGKLTSVTEYISPTTSSSVTTSASPVLGESTLSITLSYELN